MSNLIFISCREKEKGLGPISYLRAIIQLSKMVAVKERIALNRAISREKNVGGCFPKVRKCSLH